MEGTSEELCKLRCWDELIPDVLGLIFSHLSLKEILTLVPSVCKSWRKAVLEPYCWREIDIYEWSIRYWGRTEKLDRMLQMLVTRSHGSCHRLCVYGLPNDSSFAFIANHAECLQMLKLTRGEMSNSIVEQLADRLSKLTYLDLSYCVSIGTSALEAFGKHCKSLSTLVRFMRPLEHDGNQDEEAHAIATSMPNLTHLEICYMRVTTQSCLMIISHCRQLKHLDIRGCWDVKLNDNFMKKNHPNLNVIIGCFVWDDREEFNDYSYVSDELLDDMDMFDCWSIVGLGPHVE